MLLCIIGQRTLYFTDWWCVRPKPIAQEHFLRRPFSHAVMLSGLVGNCQSFRLRPQDEQFKKKDTIWTDFFILLNVGDRHVTIILIRIYNRSPL